MLTAAAETAELRSKSRMSCLDACAPAMKACALVRFPPSLQKFKMREAAVQELGLQADVAAVVGQAA